ncbi:MAG: phosphoglycerate mutase [Burkholderiaceae bacterium]|jgi:hypothetical protein|nr:phosphoglycerate mutase [Burkholderiaceae bacterium]
MPPASEPLHLLISVADALGAPVLDGLLARMRLDDTVEVDDDSSATPFEIALARAHRLPGEAGRVPWAAFEAGIVGTPCAWFQPCRWQLGLDRVTLADPAELALTEGESRALLAAVQPLLAEDGVTLAYWQPDAWLAQGELFRNLSVWSLPRALHQPLTRDVLALAPTAAQGAQLRRLQAELEMLLHEHSVNQARAIRGCSPVSALWISGAGALEVAHPPNPQVRVARSWDAAAVDELHRALVADGDARLTLCGPRRAITFTCARRLADRISIYLKPLRWQDIRDRLWLSSGRAHEH